MNDHQMIHLIKNKDYTGLEQLIDSYGSSILMTIHRILQAPPEQSEWSDVANEVFYEIWQKSRPMILRKVVLSLGSC